MADDQQPVNDITLHDVMAHMSHHFQQIDKRFEKVNLRFDQLEEKLEQGLAEAKQGREEILNETRLQANSCDQTLEQVADHEERIATVEKQLANN